jgi:hypothetical protein
LVSQDEPNAGNNKLAWGSMKNLLFLVSLILGLSGLSHAQQQLVSQQPLPDAASTAKFWSLENKVNFSIFSAELLADAITTQRGLNQGMREANPLARPFVTHGAAGQAGASALSLAAGMGAAYLLHRTHHHKAERIAVRLMITGEGAVVAHNIYALR